MVTGTQVQQYRQAHGLTVQQLAEQTGIHFLTVARFEKGAAKTLRPDHQAILEQVIGAGETLPPPNVSAPVPSPPPSMATPSLDQCADLIAQWFSELDPLWTSRLAVMKAERGFSTLQAIGTCLAYVFEHDLQMSIIRHEALEPSPWRRGERMECPQCSTLYQPSYPGQPFCQNACAEAYRRDRA